MQVFRRVFAISIFSLLLFLLMIFAFEIINENIAESGFSSGEFLLLDFSENAFSGEIFGHGFSFDFSFFKKSLKIAGRFYIFLPPFIRLGIIISGFIF